MTDTTVVQDQAAPSPRPSLSDAQLIEKYIALRDKKEALNDDHKKRMAPFNEMLEKIEAWLLDDLNRAGGESLKTESGTAYKTTRTSATVKSWTDTLEFIKQNEAWDLLEARVSKTAVVAVIEETGKPIPGVNVTQETVLNVRRS